MNLKILKILFITILIFFQKDIYSQEINFGKIFSGFSFTSSLNYVSSATILLNPNSADIFEKNSTAELKGGYGYGFTLKKRIFNDDIFIGISTEYIKINDEELSFIVENIEDYARLRVSETLEMVPVELSMYFNIPRVADNLNIYLGGGAGFYFGNRTRKMLGMESTTVSKSPMFSLNVLFGAEYFLDNHFSLNFEMKVRDGKYKVHSTFPTDHVIIDDQIYYFSKDFESKIYIDGLKVSLGLGYYF